MMDLEQLWEPWPGPYEADNLVQRPIASAPGGYIRPTPTTYIPAPEAEPMILSPESITYGKVSLRNGFEIRGMVATGSLRNGAALPNLNTVIQLPQPSAHGTEDCVVVEFSYTSGRPGYTDYTLTLRKKD